jgi:hypothetical protein
VTYGRESHIDFMSRKDEKEIVVKMIEVNIKTLPKKNNNIREIERKLP